MRPGVLLVAGLTLAVTVAAYVRLRPTVPPAAPPARGETNVPLATLPRERTIESSQARAAEEPKAATVSARVEQPVAPMTLREASPATRELVASLAQLDLRQGISARLATDWKQSFSQLLAHKDEAVPAIREFLARNLDYNYGSVPGGAQLGYSSLRLALLSGLQEIGGIESLEVMAQTLRTTADPLEIALLARAMEKLAPDQFLPLAIEAAREALSMASQGGLNHLDVGPLFELLQTYGSGAVVGDLANASSHWNYYATMALAELPQGAGIAALIQMTTDPKAVASGSSHVAERLLAQLSLDHPHLQTVLLERTRAGQIPPSAWAEVGLALSGQRLQYAQTIFSAASAVGASPVSQKHHVVFGNQHFTTVSSSANLSAQQVRDQLAFVDHLLLVASLPSAQTALLTARSNLAGRLVP